MSTMSKEITPDEAAELLESPYVESVINSRVSFTPEFKQLARRRLDEGEKMPQIFEENGIDPEILGEGRIYIFTHRIRKNEDPDAGFIDGREANKRKPSQQTKEQDLAQQVKEMTHEIAYIREEIEFLKKIHMADLEARKLWESKHQRK